jgi:outer membrane biosynthesis protein TonB
MRRAFVWATAALLLIGSLSGCAKKAADQASVASSDSLMASSPVEQPQGNLAPQTEYQPPSEPTQQAQEVPTPAPKTQKPASKPAPKRAPKSEPAGVTLEAGTAFSVAVNTKISSETANLGDTWTGEVKEPVIVGNTVVIPAGAVVNGVVTGVEPAQRGNRAYLVLGVRSVTANGATQEVSAGADSIIAGSPRARNLGAIAGGAAAGALIGKAVGGSGKGALIGGLLGGAAATGAVAKSKGYQVVINEGTVISFSVNHSVKMRS